jgi:hypothetical protein
VFAEHSTTVSIARFDYENLMALPLQITRSYQARNSGSDDNAIVGCFRRVSHDAHQQNVF